MDRVDRLSGLSRCRCLVLILSADCLVSVFGIFLCAEIFFFVLHSFSFCFRLYPFRLALAGDEMVVFCCFVGLCSGRHGSARDLFAGTGGCSDLYRKLEEGLLIASRRHIGTALMCPVVLLPLAVSC